MSCMDSPSNNRRHPLYGTVAADADLGIAFLIAETEDGQYEPIGPVNTVGDARELAEDDMRCRTRDLERGGTPSCPEVYKIWSRGYRGEYAVICQLDAATMKEVEW